MSSCEKGIYILEKSISASARSLFTRKDQISAELYLAKREKMVQDEDKLNQKMNKRDQLIEKIEKKSKELESDEQSELNRRAN